MLVEVSMTHAIFSLPPTQSSFPLDFEGIAPILKLAALVAVVVSAI